MRAYTVATAAVTLRMPTKWIDNVLSQHRIEGVVKRRQGVARRLTVNAIITLDVALRLSRTLGASMSTSLRLAGQLLAGEAQLEAGEGIAIVVNRSQLEGEIMDRLAHAVEIAPSPRRGRPPVKNKKERGCLSAPSFSIRL